MSNREPADAVPMETLLRHRDWVRALARTLHADRDRADDVEQETWRRVLERPPRHAEALRAWFARVVRTTSISVGRAARTRSEHECAVPPRPSGVSPEDAVAEAEVHACLLRAVLDLDEPYRGTVLLRYFQGLEVSEIAARSGTPVETVRTRLKRAVDRLRDRIRKDVGDDRNTCALLLVGSGGVSTVGTRRAASGAAGGVTGGGLLAMAMSAKVKIGVAAAVVLLAAGTLWGPLGGADRDAAPPVGSETSTSGSAREHAARAKARGDSRPLAAAAESAPTVPRLGGVVLDPEGAPAPGVRVILLAPAGSGTATVDLAAETRSPSVAREIRTDSSGRFAADPFDGVRAASAVALRDDGATGIAPAVRPGEDVTVTLAVPAAFVGIVTDASGAPIAGATIRAGCLVETASFVREAVTDSDGSYRVAGIPSRLPSQPTAVVAAGVEFRAEGFAPKFVPLDVFRPLAPGEERRVDARLVRGAVLSGVVVDASSGVPVDGATLTLVSEEGRSGFQLASGRGVENPFAPRTLASRTSAADGAFRIEHVPVASGPMSLTRLGVVRASKPGFADAEADVRAAGDGEVIVVRIALHPGTTVTGRVVDREGRPVEGISIWGRVGDEANRASARSGADGRYRLDGFPAPAGGASAALRAFRSYDERDCDAAERCRATVTVRAGAVCEAPDLVWDPPPWPVLRFVFIDESGAPVRDVVLQSAGDAIPIARGDDRGAAEKVQRPFPADYPRPLPLVRWVARAPGRAPAAVVIPDEPADGQEIRVVLAAGLRVSGRVVGADGTPRANVLVRALDPAVDLATVFEFDRRTSFDSLAQRWPGVPFLGAGRSGADGSFEIADLPAGAITVGAWTGQAGEWAACRDVRGGATDVVIRLPDAADAMSALGARVVVTVRDESGAPMPRCLALATGAGGARWSRVDPASPEASVFLPLRYGGWRIDVDAWGFVPWFRERFVVERGRIPEPIDVVLRRGATLRGRISLPDGVTPGGHVVLVVRESGVAAQTALAADGTFAASGFAPGRYRVVVAPEGWGGDAGASWAPASAAASVTVTAESGEFAADAACVAAGAVTVESSDRRLPLSGIACDESRWRLGEESSAEIRDASGGVVHTRHGVARPWVFHNVVLPPGRYTVRLTTPGRDAAESPFDVVAGKTTQVKLGGG